MRRIGRLSALALLVGPLAALTLVARAQNPPTPAPPPPPPAPAPPAELQAARQLGDQVLRAFDAGDPKALAALFTPEGELVDEQGNAYVGAQALAGLSAAFFERFPGAKATAEIAASRRLGPDLVVTEGVLVITSKDGASSRSPFVRVDSRRDGAWKVASLRLREDDNPPTPHERLEALAWLVGDWVGEGSGGSVTFSCKWSDDGNFLLGTYSIKVDGQAALTTTQRVGWDPLHERFRSWVFDSDGGFGDGEWATDGATWVVRSTTVLPDGKTGSATFALVPEGDGTFRWQARDRIVAGELQPDSEMTIVRTPPAARP